VIVDRERAVTRVPVAIVGAGPYGLSLAAHLASRNVAHRIFGRPMQFWSQIAEAGRERYLKSFCFGTDLATPRTGFSFADYSAPRGLETFEPCSIEHFAAYGLWFQESEVPWVEPLDVEQISPSGDGFTVLLDNGERFAADHVVVATGLSCFAAVPPALAALPPALLSHTSAVSSFKAYRGSSVAVVGGGQSALEAAALLREAGAYPQLLVRKDLIRWNERLPQQRSLWRRMRSPVSGLGVGPKSYALTHLPGAMHRVPAAWRTRFVKSHLPAEGAWWLRERVEGQLPIHCGTVVQDAVERDGRVVLQLGGDGAAGGTARTIIVDRVIAGSGYDIDVARIGFLDPKLRNAVGTECRAPLLSSKFESTVPGLRFIGPASAMSFGPLFRFVVGAGYTARVVSAHLAAKVSSATRRSVSASAPAHVRISEKSGSPA
jgi:FAD-dependent urate hydroxylase